jgi:hypothetical protein
MKGKLLILLTSLLFLTGCYTTFHHVHRDVSDYDVYTYDVNYIYGWDYYDYWYDYYPYWYPHNHYYFSLHYYPLRYPQYPYWNYYKPYKNHYGKWYYNKKYKKRPFNRRHNVWKTNHYTRKSRLMNEKTIIKRNQHKKKIQRNVQVKRRPKPKINRPGHLPGHNVQKCVQVKKKERIHRTPTFKKHGRKSSKNTHVIKPRSTKKRPSSTKRTNTKNRKSRKTRR